MKKFNEFINEKFKDDINLAGHIIKKGSKKLYSELNPVLKWKKMIKNHKELKKEVEDLRKEVAELKNKNIK